MLDLLKKLPIDLGQGNLRETTEGKRIALALVPDGDGRRALDVGCREGHQTRWLEQRGYVVTSIDISKEFDTAQVVDINEPIPFDDDSFDLVWCSEVIEHLRDPEFSLAEMRRVTRPGGELILTTPNSYAAIFRPFALVGLTPKKLQRSDHLQFFDYDAIRRLAPDAEIYGFFPYMFRKWRVQVPWKVAQLSPTFVIHIRQPGHPDDRRPRQQAARAAGAASVARSVSL
ncbi:MAG: class I SAM-dependent methyltransferase [Gemmatimonadetes bacterium]|nr:class I SAM-dependent methyltransferase [Gemmatimonadota bacterium]